ncbi:hypothetical protein L1887_35588 [Cichorium endivia]|nr:hypothetical protein L1887_35588 [Cichorium endivia]
MNATTTSSTLLRDMVNSEANKKSEASDAGLMTLLSNVEDVEDEDKPDGFMINENGESPSETPQARTEKIEAKVSGDSGYDCNYCHVKNHFSKDCMLRKKNEKKPQMKDEAYYAMKLNEVKEKTKDLSLMASVGSHGTYQDTSDDDDDVDNEGGECMMKNMNEASDRSSDADDFCLMAKDTRLTIPKQANLSEEEILRLRGRIESLKLSLEKANLRISILEECREKYLNSVAMSDVPNISYTHGIPSVEKFLTANDLLKTLPNELPILKKIIPQIENTQAKVDVIESDIDSDMEEIDCSSLTIRKSSSVSASPSEDISQLPSDDKGKMVFDCEILESSTTNENKEIVKTKIQVSDECVSYEDYLIKETSTCGMCLIEEKNLDLFKNKNLSLNEFKLAYEEYLCTSTLCSSLSRKSTRKPNWKRNDLNDDLTLKSKPKIPSKLSNSSKSLKSSKSSKTMKSKKTLKTENSKTSKQVWVPKALNISKSISSNSSMLTKSSSDSFSGSSCFSHETSENMINLLANEISEDAIEKWIQDSFTYPEDPRLIGGCSRHMTGKREYIKEYRTLDDAGNVRFGNNETCPIKGFGKVTNGQFTINRAAYVEGLKHNLVSSPNFKAINKLVAMDLVRCMSALKFDNDTLCSACEHGKQTKQKHPTVIDTKIMEPLSLLYMDLCGMSVVESLGKKKYLLVIVDDISRFTCLGCNTSSSFDAYFHLLFDPPVRAVDAETNISESQVSELSKLIYGPEASPTSSINKPSSVEGESSNGLANDIKDINAEGPPECDPNFPPLEKSTKNHPPSQVIGNVHDRVMTRAQLHQKQQNLNKNSELCMFNVFISKIEPKNVKDAFDHPNWIDAMQMEFEEFERNKV